jgi:Spy/CpxP family protein refolding chaperone
VVNRWLIILAAAIIFGAGAATGALVVRTYAPKVVKRMHVSPPLPVSNDRRQEYVSKLDRELTLSQEQRTQIEQILAASQKRMKQIWEPLEPQVKDEYKRTRREISEVLTPEQRAKMDKWRKDGRKDEKKESGKLPGDGEEKQKCCAKAPTWEFCF